MRRKKYEDDKEKWKNERKKSGNDVTCSRPTATPQIWLLLSGAAVLYGLHKCFRGREGVVEVKTQHKKN